MSKRKRPKTVRKMWAVVWAPTGNIYSICDTRREAMDAARESDGSALMPFRVIRVVVKEVR